jgi:hypothetical protein
MQFKPLITYMKTFHFSKINLHGIQLFALYPNLFLSWKIYTQC